jgi:hypothetical protein
VLAVAVVIGVVRARAHRVPPRPSPTFHGYDPESAAPPPPEPLTPSPYAPSSVRWCDARRVLEAKCVRCHSAPPRIYGAPFSLLSYADTQNEYPPGSGQLVYQRMRWMVAYGRMPPLGQQIEPPIEPLDDTERDLLLVWLREGGLAYGGESCGSGSAAAGAAAERR